MRAAIVLFTRDLRVHDHPALLAATRTAERVVPLFVLDEGVVATGFARPNRTAFLLDALADLDRSLCDLGGRLVVRRGGVVDEVRRLVEQTGADAVHASADVSAYAQGRERRLSDVCDLHLHPGVTAVPPGAVTPVGGDHYKVFTPYWRAWLDAGVREPVGVPDDVRLPDGLDPGTLPSRAELAPGDVSPELPVGGERAGRRLLDTWLEGGIAAYEDAADDLAGDATSRLSPYLHFGCVSPAEIAGRADRRRAGVSAFVRQLCWRDFHHQALAARPGSARRDYRPRGDVWNDDPDGLAAWKEGRTGYPIVDAAMRQLHREGWMHNRARLVAASFLVKDLYVDWRAGAAHFLEWLVDGDVANNQMNWQWVAGTGNDTRPNRMFNPIRQARRYDPDGAYVRRHVPQLAAIEGPAVHEPWRLGPLERDRLDYPAPIVDHDEAVARFRAARG